MRNICKETEIYNRFVEYTDLIKEIEYQSGRLACLIASSKVPSGSNITGMPSSHSGIGDKVGGAVSQIDELRCEIEQAMLREKSEHTVLEKYISRLHNPDERAVIRLRYFDGLKWEEISEILHFSSTWIYALHKKAFRQMNRMDII